VSSEQEPRDAAAYQFVGGLGAHSTAVFTATLVSMMSIAVGVQTGLLLWRATIQLTSSPDRPAMHD
jgi:hypothetical protein